MLNLNLSIRAKDTDFTKYTQTFAKGGNPVGGWSSIGNPGTFLFQTDDGNPNTGAYEADGVTVGSRFVLS